jgi:hypothetical protein
MECIVPQEPHSHSGLGFRRGMCNRHWMRFRKWGDPLIMSDRNIPKPNPSMSAIHSYLRRKHGSAARHPCSHCGKRFPGPRIMQWAHIHDTPYDKDISHYMPLCKRCHNIYDGVFEAVARANRIHKRKKVSA